MYRKEKSTMNWAKCALLMAQNCSGKVKNFKLKRNKTNLRIRSINSYSKQITIACEINAVQTLMRIKSIDTRDKWCMQQQQNKQPYPNKHTTCRYGAPAFNARNERTNKKVCCNCKTSNTIDYHLQRAAISCVRQYVISHINRVRLSFDKDAK